MTSVHWAPCPRDGRLLCFQRCPHSLHRPVYIVKQERKQGTRHQVSRKTTQNDTRRYKTTHDDTGRPSRPPPTMPPVPPQALPRPIQAEMDTLRKQYHSLDNLINQLKTLSGGTLSVHQELSRAARDESRAIAAKIEVRISPQGAWLLLVQNRSCCSLRLHHHHCLTLIIVLYPRN